MDSFRGLVTRMLGVINRRRFILSVPFWLARIQGSIFDGLKFISAGLLPTPFTRDQVAQLSQDNVVSEDARSFKDMGITPTAMDAEIADYLEPFRPYGQYDRITSSARDLRS